MKKTFKAGFRYLLLLGALLLLVLTACGKVQPVGAQPDAAAVQVQNATARDNAKTAGEEARKKDGRQKKSGDSAVSENGTYTSREEVAEYIHLFGHLPSNYITKKEAEALGWDSRAGNLWEVAPGKSIGGSRFGNYEGNLPDKNGRKYYECDIDFEGGYRGAKRIIYSNDGLIFYTEDHYKTFEQLY